MPSAPPLKTTNTSLPSFGPFNDSVSACMSDIRYHLRWISVENIGGALFALVVILSFLLCIALQPYGIIVNAISQHAHDSDPSNSVLPVSGWHGPGAWLSFVASLYIAYWNTFVPTRPTPGLASAPESWDTDLLLVLVYSTLAAGDLLHQCTALLRNPETGIARGQAPPLAAAATVVHVTFGLAFAAAVGQALMLLVRASLPNRRAAMRRCVIWSVIAVVDLIAMVSFERMIHQSKLSSVGVLAQGESFEDGFEATLDQGGAFSLRLPALTHIASLGDLWTHGLPALTLFGLPALGFALCAAYRIALADWRDLYRHDAGKMLEVAGLYLGLYSVVLVFLFVSWVFAALCALPFPGGPFAPSSGIGIAELDQMGTLITVLLVQSLRASSYVRRQAAKRWAPSAEGEESDGEMASREASSSR
jgi:hypothetical protein